MDLFSLNRSRRLDYFLMIKITFFQTFFLILLTGFPLFILPISPASADVAVSYPSSPSPRVTSVPGVITTVETAGQRVANAAVSRTWPGIAVNLGLLALSYGINSALDYLRNEPGTEGYIDPNRSLLPDSAPDQYNYASYFYGTFPNLEADGNAYAPTVCLNTFGSGWTLVSVSSLTGTSSHQGSVTVNCAQGASQSGGVANNSSKCPDTGIGQPYGTLCSTTKHKDLHCDITRSGSGSFVINSADPDCGSLQASQLTNSSKTLTFTLPHGTETLTINADSTATDKQVITNPDGTITTTTSTLSAPQGSTQGSVHLTDQSTVTRAPTTDSAGNPTGSQVVPNPPQLQLPTDYDRESTQLSISNTVALSKLALDNINYNTYANTTAANNTSLNTSDISANTKREADTIDAQLKNDSTKTIATLDAANAGDPPSGFEKTFLAAANTRNYDVGQMLNITNTGGSCPGNITASVYGRVITFDTAKFCTLAQIAGYLVMVGAAITSLKILVGGF